VAAVTSAGPREGLWYSAHLHMIDVQRGTSRTLYQPRHQLGWPAASPSGRFLAVVEAVCSDRWLVAGDLQLIETATGRAQRIDTRSVDITYTEWRSEQKLLLAGQRGLESVVCLYDVVSNTLSEVWASAELTASSRYHTVAGLDDRGDCVLAGEGFARAPEIAVIRAGQYRPVRSFDLGYGEQAKAVQSIESVSWQAPDGLEIQGWLLRPHGAAPHAVIMNIHGGPVSHWRPMWLGRPRSTPLLFLMQRGYAVFLPNPRGSSGRGQDFAHRVLGDMGGADTHDFLSGLDHLVARGWADAQRLGVMGISYGGYMSAWLITQDPRFAAAVPVSPVTNQVTEHLISNIPHFVKLFLGDRLNDPTGKYFERSPIMHAHKVKTPTLNIAGALDRCTPPEEAVQFHRALLQHEVESALLIYPREGHGVRSFPASIDYAARLAIWFDAHIPHHWDT
jgi:dipeptidyl aminopeptidase/acylaminoacyl peptidase